MNLFKLLILILENSISEIEKLKPQTSESIRYIEKYKSIIYELEEGNINSIHGAIDTDLLRQFFNNLKELSRNLLKLKGGFRSKKVSPRRRKSTNNRKLSGGFRSKKVSPRRRKSLKRGKLLRLKGGSNSTNSESYLTKIINWFWETLCKYIQIDICKEGDTTTNQKKDFFKDNCGTNTFDELPFYQRATINNICGLVNNENIYNNDVNKIIETVIDPVASENEHAIFNFTTIMKKVNVLPTTKGGLITWFKPRFDNLNTLVGKVGKGEQPQPVLVSFGEMLTHKFTILPQRGLDYMFNKVSNAGKEIPQPKLITMVTNFSNFITETSEYGVEYEILPPKTLEELFGEDFFDKALDMDNEKSQNDIQGLITHVIDEYNQRPVPVPPVPVPVPPVPVPVITSLLPAIIHTITHITNPPQIPQIEYNPNITQIKYNPRIPQFEYNQSSIEYSPAPQKSNVTIISLGCGLVCILSMILMFFYTHTAKSTTDASENAAAAIENASTAKKKAAEARENANNLRQKLEVAKLAANKYRKNGEEKLAAMQLEIDDAKETTEAAEVNAAEARKNAAAARENDYTAKEKAAAAIEKYKAELAAMQLEIKETQLAANKDRKNAAARENAMAIQLAAMNAARETDKEVLEAMQLEIKEKQLAVEKYSQNANTSKAALAVVRQNSKLYTNQAAAELVAVKTNAGVVFSTIILEHGKRIEELLATIMLGKINERKLVMICSKMAQMILEFEEKLKAKKPFNEMETGLIVALSGSKSTITVIDIFNILLFLLQVSGKERQDLDALVKTQENIETLGGEIIGDQNGIIGDQNGIIGELKTKVKELSNELDEETAVSTELENRLLKLEPVINKLETEKVVLENEKVVLENEKVVLENEKVVLENFIVNIDEQLKYNKKILLQKSNVNTKAINKLEAELTAKQLEIDENKAKAIAELQAKKLKINENEQQIKILNEKLGNTQFQIREIDEEMSAVILENEAKRVKIIELQSKINTLSSELNIVREDATNVNKILTTTRFNYGNPGNVGTERAERIKNLQGLLGIRSQTPAHKPGSSTLMLLLEKLEKSELYAQELEAKLREKNTRNTRKKENHNAATLQALLRGEKEQQRNEFLALLRGKKVRKTIKKMNESAKKNQKARNTKKKHNAATKIQRAWREKKVRNTKKKKATTIDEQRVERFEISVAKRRAKKAGTLVVDKVLGEKTLEKVKNYYDDFYDGNITIKEFKKLVRDLDLIKQFNNNQKFIKITAKRIMIFIDELEKKIQSPKNLIKRLKSLLNDLKILFKITIKSIEDIRTYLLSEPVLSTLVEKKNVYMYPTGWKTITETFNASDLFNTPVQLRDLKTPKPVTNWAGPIFNTDGAADIKMAEVEDLEEEEDE
jgi:hypothetical protein